MDASPLSRDIQRLIAKGDFASALRMLRAQGGSRIARGPGEAPSREPVPLAAVCGGREAVAAAPSGAVSYYLVRRGLQEAVPDSAAVGREYSAVLRGARQRFDDDAALDASPALCHAADGGPGDLLFARIQTRGPAEETIFLIGMMQYLDGRLVFEQCLARDGREEEAILQVFVERYADARVLVTFDGQARDMSTIRRRAAARGIELPRRRTPHLDLLRESRRRWRGDVPNFRLLTLERHLCARRRVGAIPPSQIARAYERFAAAGDARPIGEILHHNVLDLLTMAQLVVAILTGCGPAV